MILVDASVVIDYVRGKDVKLRTLLPQKPVAICGVTRAEVLSGARSAVDRQNLLSILFTFQQLSIPDSVWDVVGDCLAALRASGITLPFQDIVLAVLAMH